MSTSHQRARIWTLLLAGLGGCYVLASLLYVRHQATKLARERERVYAIADHLELTKAALRDASVRYDPRVALRTRDPHAEEIPHAQCLLPKGQRCFVVSYSAPSEARRKELEPYFSDLVLGRNFSWIAKDDLGFIEFDWDKP